MNREFEILNRKLDMLFDELLWLRRDFQRDKFEKEIKELEYKVKKEQDELNFRKENNRFIFDELDNTRNRFYSIEREFPKNEMNCERVEREN